MMIRRRIIIIGISLLFFLPLFSTQYQGHSKKDVPAGMTGLASLKDPKQRGWDGGVSSSSSRSSYLQRRLSAQNAKVEEEDGTVDAVLLFYSALSSGVYKTVDYLLEKGLSINGKTSQTLTLMMEVIRRGGISANDIEYMIYRGADPNIFDKYGRNSLHLAAHYGRLEIIRYLLGYNLVDINSPDSEGNTPLHHAVYGEQILATKLLMGFGASPNTVNYEKMSPLHVIANLTKTPESVAIASLLLFSGANVNSRDINGNTPLHLAAANGNLDIVKVINPYKPDLIAANHALYWPISVAIICGHSFLSKELMPPLLPFDQELFNKKVRDNKINEKEDEKFINTNNLDNVRYLNTIMAHAKNDNNNYIPPRPFSHLIPDDFVNLLVIHLPFSISCKERFLVAQWINSHQISGQRLLALGTKDIVESSTSFLKKNVVLEVEKLIEKAREIGIYGIYHSQAPKIASGVQMPWLSTSTSLSSAPVQGERERKLNTKAGKALESFVVVEPTVKDLKKAQKLADVVQKERGEKDQIEQHRKKRINVEETKKMEKEERQKSQIAEPSLADLRKMMKGMKKDEL